MNRIPFGHSFLSAWCILLGALLVSPTVLWRTDGAEPPAPAAANADTQKKPAQGKDKPGQEKKKPTQAAKQWKPLVGSWETCEFGGDGPVEIKDKLIKIGSGDPLTGVFWKGKVVRENYEIELEARRTDGYDFFCALTYPVGKDHVSFVLGGWGGGVVGISSIDGSDASDNPTTSFRNFEDDKWYKIRVRVEPNELSCYIDDKLACDHARKDHEFDIRYEMDSCVPLGLAAYQCAAEYRNIRWRKLTDKEIEAAKKKK